jgi:hypothetical protein
VLHGAGITTDLLAADEAVWAAAFDDQLPSVKVPPIFVLLDDGADVLNECSELF